MKLAPYRCRSTTRDRSLRGMPGFTPWPFPVTGSPPFFSAYWADVDTRPDNGSRVYYRISTDQALLNRASNEISSLFAQQR